MFRRLSLLLIALAALLAIPLTLSAAPPEQRAPTATPLPSTPRPGDSAAAAEATEEADSEADADEFDMAALYAELPFSRAEDGGFVLGEEDAPITIIEFSDFACPHCINYTETIDRIVREYVATGQAKFELRVMPTAGGQLTVIVAAALECADDITPGSFWKAQHYMYELARARQYDQTLGTALSELVDIPLEDINACLSEVEAPQVIADMELADANGINGTPAVMIRYGDGDPQFAELDGETYDRGGPPYGVLSALIEAAQ